MKDIARLSILIRYQTTQSQQKRERNEVRKHVDFTEQIYLSWLIIYDKYDVWFNDANILVALVLFSERKGTQFQGCFPDVWHKPIQLSDVL